MVFATSPLQEQLTLFWHDHFAIEYGKVRTKVTQPPGDNVAQNAQATGIMKTYMELMREGGIKDLRTLLIDMTRSPAMLLYLDNYLNVAGRSQENYSRELMELFSMGVNQYTEDDVRELARVLTGESLDDRANLGYLYRDASHDTDLKTFLGQTIDLPAGEDETSLAIDIILDQGVSAEFIASKLFAWFVNPDPDPVAVSELVAILRADSDSSGKPDFNLRTALEVLFKSQYFYDPANFFSLYKTPADFAVSLIRGLGLTETELAVDANWYGLAALVRNMGMGVFEPPNVGGWVHGEAWINSVSLISRYNLAERVARTDIMNTDFLNAYFKDAPNTLNSEILDEFRERLVQDTLRPGEETVLSEHMDAMDELNTSQAVKYLLKILSMAHLMCAVPKFHLK